MLRLKKTIVAMMIVTSTVVAAGTLGPVCTPGSITVPCAGSAWEFGAQALYLNRNYSSGAFTQTTVNTLVVNPSLTLPYVYDIAGSVDNYNTANNQWNWGFQLDGAYYFHMGNDLNLSWYHYTQTSNQTIEQGYFANSVYDNPSAAQFYSNVANQIKTQWDAVNLELGQVMDISERTKVRVQGGFQYAYVQTVDNNNATSPSTAGTVSNQVWSGGSIYDQVNSFSTLTYNGFGPRLGADLWYDWNNGLGIYAKAASALLLGSRSFQISELSTVNSAGVPNSGALGTPYTIGSRGSDTVIVPELEIKAGATYSYALSQGALSVDAGWMLNHYFNVLATNGSDFEDTIGFGVQGPYLGVAWRG